MSGANFNGLVLIYQEDVLRKVKGCESHYNQSVEKKAQSLQVKKDSVRYFNHSQSIQPCIHYLKTFIDHSKLETLQEWLACWNDRKSLIFCVFTDIHAPRSKFL